VTTLAVTTLAGQIAAGGAVLSGPGGAVVDAVVDAGALRGTGVAAGIEATARVAIHLKDPLDVIRALAALDGQVAALLLLSHAIPGATAAQLARAAGCTILLDDAKDDADYDAETGEPESAAGPPRLPLAAALGPERQADPVATQWLMTTSGTTGLPKIVPHSLATLARSVVRLRPGMPGGAGLGGAGSGGADPVWGLLYDPTRFAGLQVVLQALIGGGRLVAVDTGLPIAAQVAALAEAGVTHLSATPTLWRRILMAPGHGRMALRQATLGGEIADQPTLAAVRAAFPAARLAHIYASTEAGVGFSVTDGQAGFPRAWLDAPPGPVRLRLQDGILWLRPPVTALRPGQTPGVEIDAEGYVRSGDRVEVAGERVLFLGRENGLINIGGVKVYPETVEAVVKTVPGVALVQVSAKQSPVTGALVVAEVQLAPGADPETVRLAIQSACRARLEREAVPAIIRFVAGFATNAAGKLVRTG
jgi:acyl-CoA synthetase (AMP-forming)/AMP-acid ligase II